MGTISVTVPNDGETIDASDVSTPINTIVNAINGNLDSNNIAASGVATANIADDAVTAAKMLNGLVKHRQGGATGDASWDTQGTSNTDTSAKNVFIQVGSNVASGGVDKVVTFPVAFNQVPIVIATTSSATSRNVFTSVIATTTTTFTVRQLDDTGTTGSEDFNWVAIGQ